MKRVTFSADDFGLTVAVNEAVERAHREGILDQASLMVGAPAAEDAIRRARALPSLRVGLHVVLVSGGAVSPPAFIPHLVDDRGEFSSNQALLGFRYFFAASARRELAHEIQRQFAAFAASGLTLNHADAHRHMHLHPTVARLIIDIGRRYGLGALRIPAEPPATMRALGMPPRLGDRALYAWTRQLRARVLTAGLSVTDHCFGIAWSGHMTRERVHRLLAALPDGTSEIYFHPATNRDATLRRLMPDYEHVAEFETLLDRSLLDHARDA
jgi:hopanoid biosynthesis associated protein HpnK